MTPDPSSIEARSPAPAAPRHRRWAVHAILLLAALMAGGLIVAGVVRRRGGDEPPPVRTADPPLTALTSPFLNTRPGVKYVGDAACKRCHSKISHGYHAGAMGHSMTLTSPGDGLEHYPANFEAPHLHLSVARRGGRVYHTVAYRDEAGKPIPGVEPVEAAVPFAMGSGTQGRSYLVNHEDHLLLSPISWYRHTKGGWDLSPSYRSKFQHFNRQILDRCVYCHADGAMPVAGTVNRYRLAPGGLRAIGCERCHGPGELHVQARPRHGEDPVELDRTIVNPRRLGPALREAVCQQCHLQGSVAVVRRGRSLWDYRPGLPLPEIVRVFVKPPEMADNYKAVSQVQQMQISACFRGSKGDLGCITCHNPHAEPAAAERLAHYRRACLGCHARDACHVPMAVRRRRQDDCVACHMPRASSSDVAHAAVTDHRIIRSADKAPRPQSGLGPDDVPLLAFHRDRLRGPDPEQDRDLGLALVTWGDQMPEGGIREYFLRRARPLLKKALERAPGDVAAAVGQGHGLLLLGRSAEALACLEKALAQAPRHETVLDNAARAALALGRYDAALDYAGRLAAADPWLAANHALLATVHAEREEWPAARDAARAALKLDPADVSARSVLIGYHLAHNDRVEARAEYDRLMALEPVDKQELRRWFEPRLR